ncbi:MAG: hypothetical protein HJJLKODD_01536 [Phycisphaerae bacterium]|nr:hypothetical protein [Phycisphaerae bacterium]
MRVRIIGFLGMVTVGLLLGSACQEPVCHPPTVEQQTFKQAYPGLKNVSQFNDQLINGSAPESREAFETLRSMGIHTIISVDGARPEVELARQFGIRYVHLPIGYDGITPEEGRQLIAAYRDLPKPIYLHCYKGLHRGPAAGAYILVGSGQCPTEQAKRWMFQAGMSEEYPGLIAAVEQRQVATVEELGAPRDDYPSVAKVGGFSQLMSGVARSVDHLKLVQQAGWQTPADHPDLAPANEGKILYHYFTALAEEGAQNNRPAALQEGLTRAVIITGDLLLLMESESPPTADLDQLMVRLDQECKSCHHGFRN